MRTSRLIYIFIFLYFLPLAAQAQFFNPPYKAIKLNIFSDNAQYFIESINPDSANKPNYIGIQNYGLLNPSLYPSQMRIFDSEFKLIDAVNTNAGESYLQDCLFLSDFDNDGKNEIIVPVIGEHIVKFYYINLRSNSADKITFLTIPFTKKKPFIFAKYIRVSDNLLIICINTLFPGKHGYRRIYAIDTQNFTVKWEKPTADYLETLFRFPQQSKVNYFYYLTNPYDNGLVFSNKTFYRLSDVKDTSCEKQSNLLVTKAAADTFFGEKPFPYPDSSAADYSNDSVAYLVKTDLKGNVVLRKRFGGRFNTPSLIFPITKDSMLFIAKDRIHNIVEIKLFLKDKQTIKTIKKIKHNGIISVWRKGNYVFFSYSHKLWKNSLGNINAKTDTIYTKYMYSVFQSNTNYFLNIGDEYYHLFNKQFEKVADIPYSGLGTDLTYIKSLNVFALRKQNSTKFYKLEKASFRERLNKTTFKWISTTLIIILIVILMLWIYTMKLSRKKIEKNYKLLQESKRELEAATSQLVRSGKLAVLGTIASAVAHQLNSPLGAILNSAQRLQSTDNINVEDNVNLIKKAAIRSKKIVERFLNASRPINTKESKTDLNKLLKDFLELFSHQFEISGITIKQEIESNIFIKISPGYFNEVLTNIFFNARDSIIEAEQKDRFIYIFCKSENNIAIIEIKDTGIGFSDVVLTGGFEAFLTTKEKGEGTGLGLWIVERIISGAHGKIEIGNYEQGAYVRIELPLAE